MPGAAPKVRQSTSGARARAAHAAEHHATELPAHLVGKGGEVLRLLRHRVTHRKPAQTIANLRRTGVALPYGRIAGPDAPRDLGHVAGVEPDGHSGIEARNTAECLGGAWAPSTLRFVPITPSSVSNDLANFSIPSSSSARVTSAKSMPPAASRSMTGRPRSRRPAASLARCRDPRRAGGSPGASC